MPLMMVMMLVQIQPGTNKIKMILKNSSQIRIFNSKGFEHEISLLINLFNKFDVIKNILKMIKIYTFISFDFIKILNKIKTDFYKKYKIFIDNFKEKSNLDFSLKLIYKNFIFFILKNNFEKIYKIDFFFKLILKKNLCKQKKFFFNSTHKKNRNLFLKNNYYKNSLEISKKINLKDKNNSNIFITGEAFNYYTGSITPFSKAKNSWFISTGLKSDVECSDLNLLDTLYTKEEIKFFYKDKAKSIIFKVKNFKNKIFKKIKRNARYFLFYNTHHYFGLQRFINESKSSFFLLQQQKKLQHLIIFFTMNIKNIHSKKIIFINENYFFTMNIFNIHSKKNNYFGLFNKKIKGMVIFFRISKSILDYYLILSKAQTTLFNYSNYSGYFYKSLILFQKSYKIFLLIFQKIFQLEFYLIKSKTSIKNKKIMEPITFLQTFYFNINFFKKLINRILKLSFFDLFFEIFLVRKFRLFYIKTLLKEDAFLNVIEKNEIQDKLLKKPYWFYTYKLFFYFFIFLIDWNMNFNILITSNNLNNFCKNGGVKDLLNPLSNLKKKWSLKNFLNIKELHSLFFSSLEKFSEHLCNFFYLNFLVKKSTSLNLDIKFFISNLFIYIYKLTYKKKDENFIISNEIIKFSSFFLGKWFYYKQINKLTDKYLDLNYNIFSENLSMLNFSQKESYVYNLKKLNSFGILIYEKLDSYLKFNKNLRFAKNYQVSIKKQFKKKLFLSKKFDIKLRPIQNSSTNPNLSLQNLFFKNDKQIKQIKKPIDPNSLIENTFVPKKNKMYYFKTKELKKKLKNNSQLKNNLKFKNNFRLKLFLRSKKQTKLKKNIRSKKTLISKKNLRFKKFLRFKKNLKFKDMLSSPNNKKLKYLLRLKKTLTTKAIFKIDSSFKTNKNLKKNKPLFLLERQLKFIEVNKLKEFKKSFQPMIRKEFFTRLRTLFLQDLYKTLNTYRSERWFKKLSQYKNNFLEIGLNYQLPKRFKNKLFKTSKRTSYEIRYFKKISKKMFRNHLSNLYKQNIFKEKSIVLTNTFLCVYNNIKYKKIYSKLNFWFLKY